MKQLFTLILLFIFMSGLAYAQTGDSDETLLEQARALAEEQSPGIDPVNQVLNAVRGVSHPLFVGVDDITIPAYQIDPLTNDTIPAFVGAEVWGSK